MASVTASAATLTPTKSAAAKARRAALSDITNDSSPVVGSAEAVLKTPPPSSSRKPCCSVDSLLRERAQILLGMPAAAEEAGYFQEVEIVVASDADGPTDSPVSSADVVEPVSSAVEERRRTEDRSRSSDGGRTSIKCEDRLPSEDLSESLSVLTRQDRSRSYDGGSGESSSVKCGAGNDDCSSGWSFPSNASCFEGEAGAGEEEDVYYEVEEHEYTRDDEEEEEDDYLDYQVGSYEELLLDGLCKGITRLTFAGKHTRFVYNSDGEMEGEEEEVPVSPNKVLLKGMPAPQGKHLRFSEDDEA